jgi:hypothetical protein
MTAVQAIGCAAVSNPAGHGWSSNPHPALSRLLLAAFIWLSDSGTCGNAAARNVIEW